MTLVSWLGSLPRPFLPLWALHPILNVVPQALLIHLPPSLVAPHSLSSSGERTLLASHTLSCRRLFGDLFQCERLVLYVFRHLVVFGGTSRKSSLVDLR